MIGLLGGGFRFMVRLLIRFLNRSVSLAMGCFFGCFRIRDDASRPQIAAKSIPPQRAVSRNRLSALFIDEERGESAFKFKESGNSEFAQIESLKEEAKFLKACGTIPETPAELRKKSNKLKHSPPCHGDSESSKFNTWMPHASINRFQTDKQPDQSSVSTSKKPCEDEGREAVHLDERSGSAESAAMDADSVTIGSTEERSAMSTYKAARFPFEQITDATLDSPWPSALDVQGKNKSVRFELDVGASSSKGSSEDGTPEANQSNTLAKQPKRSPNPTPLKISDEMQTPGTVFPTNLDALANRKTRVRSQYVYTVPNPGENISQRSSKEVLHELNESAEWEESVTPKAEGQAKQASVDQEVQMEGSLSSWLKPKSCSNNDQNLQGASSNDQKRIGRAPMDRPIIGMVAAHWNENEPTQVSPKWWDGNGIPNSTNKYKEDQKVSWHATPFEERLEKALSEESFISQRKQLSGPPMVFDENDESDTALSQLRPSTHSKSVVSF